MMSLQQATGGVFWYIYISLLVDDTISSYLFLFVRTLNLTFLITDVIYKSSHFPASSIEGQVKCMLLFKWNQARLEVNKHLNDIQTHHPSDMYMYIYIFCLRIYIYLILYIEI